MYRSLTKNQALAALSGTRDRCVILTVGISAPVRAGFLQELGQLRPELTVTSYAEVKRELLSGPWASENPHPPTESARSASLSELAAVDEYYQRLNLATRNQTTTRAARNLGNGCSLVAVDAYHATCRYRAERARSLRRQGVQVVAAYLDVSLEAALGYAYRDDEARVEDIERAHFALLAVPPNEDEGFDAIYRIGL